MYDGTIAWYLMIFMFTALWFLPFFRGLVAWVIKLIRRLRYLRYLRSLPSPPRHWLLGHVNKLGGEEKHMKLSLQWHKDFPDLFVQWFGPFLPEVVVTDPEFKKILLKSAEPKSPFYYFLVDWIGYGLLLSSGDKWFRHRKLLTPAFHFDILKSYVSIANEVTHSLLDMWQEHADKGTTFDVTDYTSLYTLDILLRCAFSDHTSNCLVEKDANPYVEAVHGISKTFVPRVIFPPYHYDWIFNFSPLGRKFHRYVKILHDYSEKAIKKRTEQLLANSADLSRKHIDFLDVLLSTKDENGDGLTDVEVREEVDTFMFEGHDTIASGLNWILYCLATNPDHQGKCRNEAKEALSDNDDITWENLNKLEYITMCIKESLRIYPPVPVIARQLTEDYVFKDYHIQKGTLISINVLAHHHLPQLWPDPEKFNPLRFTTENIKARDSFLYTPFSAGPRNCIGQHLAMDELKIAVAHIVNRFYIEADPSHKIERLYSLTMKAKYGIMLKLSSV